MNAKAKALLLLPAPIVFGGLFGVTGVASASEPMVKHVAVQTHLPSDDGDRPDVDQALDIPGNLAEEGAEQAIGLNPDFLPGAMGPIVGLGTAFTGGDYGIQNPAHPYCSTHTCQSVSQPWFYGGGQR